MNKNTLFPVMDRLIQSDYEKLNAKFGSIHGPLLSLGVPAKGVSAKWTGEKRAPKAGEWYLSGSIVEAYRAPNNLETPFHIAKLVLTKTETITYEC